MSLIHSSSAISIVEWSGVAASLTGSVLNAQGRRSSFVFWSLSALLLGTVAWYLGCSGLLVLQGAGMTTNLYGMRNWQGNAPTRALAQEN